MPALAKRGWQEIRLELEQRIHNHEWAPGQLIPKEQDLAAELGCSRTTVNRALQHLASSGWLDRRRRAGTRITRHPPSNATLRIPVIREEIESAGMVYGYHLVSCQRHRAMTETSHVFPLQDCRQVLHLLAVHYADHQPFVLEDRLINLDAVSAASTADFATISANEWLLQHALFSHGALSFGAARVTSEEAILLGSTTAAPHFVMDRKTWNQETGGSITIARRQPLGALTSVRLVYRLGYRLEARL